MRWVASIIASFCLSIGAAFAHEVGELSESELRACLASYVAFDLVDMGEVRHTESSFSARREPPQGEEYGWRRPDRVLTVEDPRRGVTPWYPFDPSLPYVGRWLNVSHAFAIPLSSISFSLEAGPLLRPYANGASLLIFPGGLAPFEPYRQRFGVVFPKALPPVGDTVELRLLPIDATDGEGRSFIRDFGQAVCAIQEVSPNGDSALSRRDRR